MDKKEVFAHKFVEHDIPPVSTLKKEEVYILNKKVKDGGELTREEKDRLYKMIRSSSYSGDTGPFVRRGGYIFVFSAACKLYYVEQYGRIFKTFAPDKTSIRRGQHGRITRIVEVE